MKLGEKDEMAYFVLKIRRAFKTLPKRLEDFFLVKVYSFAYF